MDLRGGGRFEDARCGVRRTPRELTWHVKGVQSRDSSIKHQASGIDILPCRRTRTTRELLNKDHRQRGKLLALRIICWNARSLDTQTLPTFQHVKLIRCKQPLTVKKQHKRMSLSSRNE